MRLIMTLFALLMLAGCDTATKAKPYATLTPDEEARQALDDEEYELAIERYEALVEEDPEGYERYRFLAAAYAASAGFDIIAAAKGGIGGGSGSLLDSLGSFLPADPTDDQITRMGLAKDALLTIPEDLRSKDNTEVEYASGAAAQLELYQSAYSIMYINRFAQVTDTGAIDASRLETMSDADVTNILENFNQVAQAGGEGVPQAAQEVLAQVSQQEGATDRERLINFIKSKNGTPP